MTMKKQSITEKNSKKPQIKTVWFDLGNVILPFNFRPAFKRLSGYSPAAPRDFADFFHNHPRLEKDSDRGVLTGRLLYRLLVKRFKIRGLSYGCFKTIWNGIFSENRAVTKIIRQLKRRGIRLIMVSNTNRMHFEYIRRRYSVVGIFDRVILSYEAGDRKPGGRIYRMALKASGTAPRQILYTDDKEDLVAAARKKCGVSTHHFKTADKLRAALKAGGAFNLAAVGRLDKDLDGLFD